MVGAAEIIRLPSSSVVDSSRLPPTTLSSRDLPREMFYDEILNTAPLESAPAESSRRPPSMSFGRNTIDASLFRRDLPDRSKHNVSPSALTAALEKYSGDFAVCAGSEDNVEETSSRNLKRARFDELRARLPKFVFPAADPPSGLRVSEENLKKVKSKPVSTVDEDSYWSGTIGQSGMQSSKVVTEGTSSSARRRLAEYISRNPLRAPMSPPTVNTSKATVLTHGARASALASEVSMAAVTANEDEGFTLVSRAQTISPMSSPELVPAPSIAQTMIDEQTASDDDWTDVEI